MKKNVFFDTDVPAPRYDPDTFSREVYAVVAAIPRGKIVSYGEIARLLGHPSRSRMVGRALKKAPEGLPCHRVVNCRGRLAPGWAAQRTLLESEGVAFLPDGRVDKAVCGWRFTSDEYPEVREGEILP